MNTHNTIVNSIVKTGNTTKSISWINPYTDISACIVPAREAIRWSLCSFISTVSTAVDSVFSRLENTTTKNPQQTIKHGILAIPSTDAFGAVGIPYRNTNYTVVDKVEQPDRRSGTFKFGKV